MADRSYLSIGEVLTLLRPEFPDLTISKIRFLESQGLLDPERTPSGYRKFYDGDVDRLRWILRQQREQYLPLKVIKGRLVETTEPEDDEAAFDATPLVGNERLSPPVVPDVPRAVAPEEPMSQPEPSASPAFSTPNDGNPLATSESGVSMSIEELAGAVGLEVGQVQDLERFGLIVGRTLGRDTYYDEDCLLVAKHAAGFLRFGVEARHLRMYKTAAEREAGFFEQLVMPMLKQRNPQARKQALDTLGELGRLGVGMRNAMLRQALRDHLG